jgi:hypothetical protein
MALRPLDLLYLVISVAPSMCHSIPNCQAKYPETLDLWSAMFVAIYLDDFFQLAFVQKIWGMTCKS